MSNCIFSKLAAKWFSDFAPLAYWIARRWARRALDYRGRSYSPNDVDELAQDAVCRGFQRFVNRCEREVCGASDRKRWICQCIMRGVRDAVRAKASFGSISSAAAVRDDAMNRFTRVQPGAVHGDEWELLAFAPEIPLDHPVQRWELDELIERELPQHLRDTATFAAIGLTHAESATLQGVTDRTVRRRLCEIREYLDPSTNVYAIIVDALQTVLQPADEPLMSAF